MCAKNRKLSDKKWARLRQAARWLAAKTRSGLAALGLQGLFVVALAILALCAIQVARRRAGRMRHFRVYPSRIRAQAPPWCADDLAKVKFPRESYSIFEPGLTREVAEAYLASPWVAVVERVEKRFPNELRVELVLRQPAAFVRLPSACHAIDPQGVLLPLDYQRWDHALRPIPLIFGVTSQPPRPGERWADRRVGAATAVLRALATEPAVLREVQIVDVANLDGEIDPLRSEILLFTRRRVRIAWGRPPDTTRFGEPPVAQKLEQLRGCLARPLALSDAAHIDLRFPGEDTVARQ